MEAEYDNEKFYFQERPDAILGKYRIPNSLTDLLKYIIPWERHLTKAFMADLLRNDSWSL